VLGSVAGKDAINNSVPLPPAPLLAIQCPWHKRKCFEIANIEVWTLTPASDVEQAKRIEERRRFIFDNGNFLEQ